MELCHSNNAQLTSTYNMCVCMLLPRCFEIEYEDSTETQYSVTEHQCSVIENQWGVQVGFSDLLIGDLNLCLQEIVARLLMLNLTIHPPPTHRDKDNCAPGNHADHR